MKGFSYIRKLYGVSLDDVAHFVGVTNQSVSAWEQKGVVPEKRLDKISEYFDIPKEFFNIDVSPNVEYQIKRLKFSNDAKHYGFPPPDNRANDDDFDKLFAEIKQNCQFKSQLLLLQRFLKVINTNTIPFLQHILSAVEQSDIGIPSDDADDFLEALVKIMSLWKLKRVQEKKEYEELLASIPEPDDLY